MKSKELVRITIPAGSKPTPETIARIKEAAKHPITFDKDCPQLTDKQLEEFRPANFDTWEDRYNAMKKAGINKEKIKLKELTHA